jgi:hypothetical protein
VSKLPALILRRSDRLVVPRPRLAADDGRSVPVIRRGADALQLLEIAPPSNGLNPGSLLLGFAVGAVVATRRRSR